MFCQGPLKVLYKFLGYMVTGWIDWNGRWYYCGDDGAMYLSLIHISYNPVTKDKYD